MTEEAHLQNYEAEVLRLIRAAHDGHISQEDMDDEIDELVHPHVNKRLFECADNERAVIAAWFERMGDKQMLKAESLLPGITANPGVGTVQ